MPPHEWPAEMRGALAALRPPNPRHPFPQPDERRPKGLNILGTFAHHPELARAYHTFNGHVLFATSLTARERELAVLRVAVLRGAQYEWAQHVVMARESGMTDEEIARVADGPGAAGWSPRERALLTAVDELVGGADVSDGTWRDLNQEFDVRQLMDLVFTVGAYEVLAMALRAFRVALDDDLVAACGNDLLAFRDW